MKKSLLFLVAFLVATISARAEFYLYGDLGTVVGYNYYAATGINNHGNVVGDAFDSGGHPVAFRYISGAMTVTASPGPSHSTWGNAINNSDTIVGLCDRTGHPLGNVLHAFYANASGGAVDFDSDFTRNSEAKAITDSGYVVGSLTGQSFLGHTSGWIMPLGPILGNSFAARDVNESLVVVGNGPWGGMTYDAWSGTTTYLGYAVGSWSNQASAINNSGTVAGKLGTQGYLYNAGAVTFFGSNISGVAAINANGDVVGSLNGDRAFVYIHSNGHFLDLNSCVASSISSTWKLTTATGINDSGQICGQARRLATPADGLNAGTYIYRAFRLSPFYIIFNPVVLTATQ